MNSNWFPRWIAALLIAASGANLLPAAENESAPLSTPDGATNFSLSVGPPAKRAAWQERLTLGPGDVLNLSLFDMPDTTWPEVVIRPDGRLTFLQARDIVASGLTIDELRAKLDGRRDPVRTFGENSPADTVARFEDEHVESRFDEARGRGKSRNSRPDDNDIGHCDYPAVVSPPNSVNTSPVM